MDRYGKGGRKLQTLKRKVMPFSERGETATLGDKRRIGRRKRKRVQKKKQKMNQKKRQKRPIKITPYKTGDRVNLRALLCNKTRDYLINNEGKKIKVCDLEDKVVALYLYEEGFTNDLTETLRIAYQQLVSVENRLFEVVLVYMYNSWNTHGRTNLETFTQTFSTMPWLAIPFQDINSAKLPRFFRYPFELDEWHPSPSLVIIGPRGEYVVPFGAATILKNFGTQAYPFTREIAYKLLAERVKNMKLEMLWRPNTVFVRDCVFEESTSEEVVVPFAKLAGKRIIVFCECTTDDRHLDFRVKLLEKYKETKGGNDEFEVIYLKGETHGAALQWLIPRPMRRNAIDALDRIFYYGYGILVFDVDGRVVRGTSTPQFEDSAFPFYAGSIEEEVRRDLMESFVWDYGDAMFRS